MHLLTFFLALVVFGFSQAIPLAEMQQQQRNTTSYDLDELVSCLTGGTCKPCHLKYKYALIDYIQTGCEKRCQACKDLSKIATATGNISSRPQRSTCC